MNIKIDKKKINKKMTLEHLKPGEIFRMLENPDQFFLKLNSDTIGLWYYEYGHESSESVVAGCTNSEGDTYTICVDITDGSFRPMMLLDNCLIIPLKSNLTITRYDI